MSIQLFAQDIYKVENISSEDLNGTARYVGMGGAMSALGADISAIGSNPASIGLYRKYDFALTGSITTQNGNFDNTIGKKTRGSFDQAGLVAAIPLNGNKLKYVNFAFNYQKVKNFKNFIGLDNIALGGLSQSMEAANLASLYGSNSYTHNYVPIADAAYNSYMIDPITDSQGSITGWDPSHAQDYSYQRYLQGGIQQYNFNVSFNINDQVYLGFTTGIYNLKWDSWVGYKENLIDNINHTTHPYYMDNAEYMDGTGIDFKLGAIIRPVQESPFRFGVAVSTPIFFDMTTAGDLYMESPYQNVSSSGTVLSETTEAGYRTNPIDFRVRTPWKLNLSLATTVGSKLALGAEYEAKFMHSAYVGYPESYHDGYYDWGFTRTEADRALNNEIDLYTKTVHTLKIGAEAQVLPKLFVRAGYNYVSKPFDDKAILNLCPNIDNNYEDSESGYTAVGTDFVNLGATNRFTCGLGYHGKHFYADAAFQYQTQKADVYPFHLPVDDNNYRTNALAPQSVNLNRCNFMLTLGVKF